MKALEPIIVNDFYGKCTQCQYKSRKSLTRSKVEELIHKHILKTGHVVALLNHSIRVDVLGRTQSFLNEDDPPPF